MPPPLIPALAALAVLLSGACGGGAERATTAAAPSAASAPCPPPPDPGTALPLDLPLPPGGVVRTVAEQGRTSVSLLDVPGGVPDIVRVRDEVVQGLVDVGYRLVDTDQEPGFEAEAEVAGPYDGTLRVTPLCAGVLEVRYAVLR